MAEGSGLVSSLRSARGLFPYSWGAVVYGDVHNPTHVFPYEFKGALVDDGFDLVVV